MRKSSLWRAMPWRSSCDLITLVAIAAAALWLPSALADPETVDGLLAPPPPVRSDKRGAAASSHVNQQPLSGVASSVPVTAASSSAASAEGRIPKANYRIHRFHPDSLARPLSRQGKCQHPCSSVFAKEYASERQRTELRLYFWRATC